MLDFENKFYNNKIKIIAGCDEAGRGPLCGPVVAAACIFKKDYQNDLINDSKKLTDKKRKQLFLTIIKDAVAYGIGYVSPIEIDKINIYEASKLAMKRALNNINTKIDLVLTDAMKMEYKDIDVIPIIKGDAKAMCIAGASIIAKVCRDNYMDAMDKKYPGYGFKKHKGYPTKLHIEKLNELGPIKGFYRYTYGPVRDSLIKEIKLF